MNDILIIEDDADLRGLLREWLETVFHRCEVVAAPRDDGIAAVAGDTPPRAILIDVDSLGTPAVDAIERLRRAAPEAAIYAITMDNHDALCQEVTGAGAAACVRKVDLGDELLPMLRALLNPETAPLPGGQEKTVVCIEDEPEMIRLIEYTLQRGPFRVIGAVSGEQGLELARHVQPDVVLLDLMMPDMDGWEVARRMREDEALRDVPIIAVSVVQPRSYPGRELPVDDYVTKPFVPGDLLRRVGEAVRVVA